MDIMLYRNVLIAGAGHKRFRLVGPGHPMYRNRIARGQRPTPTAHQALPHVCDFCGVVHMGAFYERVYIVPDPST